MGSQLNTHIKRQNLGSRDCLFSKKILAEGKVFQDKPLIGIHFYSLSPTTILYDKANVFFFGVGMTQIFVHKFDIVAGPISMSTPQMSLCE